MEFGGSAGFSVRQAEDSANHVTSRSERLTYKSCSLSLSSRDSQLGILESSTLHILSYHSDHVAHAR